MQDPEFRQFIERVKLRSPVEVAIGERVSGLRQKGVLWWACCPFHQERTPSFAVDPRRATWRCFGACGEGGDVISFVERFDGLSFLDALRLLARQCGEEFPERNLRGRARGEEARRDDGIEFVRWAAAIYRECWQGNDGAAARAYMSGRGLGTPVLEAFGVGWAPENGQTLVQRAQRDKIALERLIEVGLVRRTDGGRAYDFFRGRVLIPIRDRLGRTVGFGGRVLAGAPPDAPKYVNTSETALFHKGRLIFALDLAAAEVRRTGRLLVVEGYTDVMAAHQAGWKSAVAVLGTATTEDHAALIRRSGARNVVLVFDGDEAGRKATARALLGLLRLPIQLSVAVLPEGRDPGDLLVEADGAERFRAAVEGAREWFDWSLEGLAGRRGADLASAVDERFHLLVALERPLERSARLAEMARYLALPEADVRAQWAAFVRTQRPAVHPPATAVAPPRGASAPRPAQGVERAFESLLGALLLDNSLVPLHGHWFEHCPSGDVALFARTLLERYASDTSGEPIDASALMTALGDHPARAQVMALQALAETAESAEALATDAVRWLERARRDATLADLGSALAKSESSAEEDALLEHLHRELRNGRVPTHQPESVQSP